MMKLPQTSLSPSPSPPPPQYSLIFAATLVNLFMKGSKNSQASRKPWYRRVMEMGAIRKTFSKSAEISTRKPTSWKSSIAKSTEVSTTNSCKQKPRKCTSLKKATSFTRVCLCAPIISSYTEVFQAHDHQVNPPRRSNGSYPRSKPLFPNQHEGTLGGRISLEGRRRIFRGKSLRDDVLMRRFVVEEEARIQVIRRRNQMEIIRDRVAMRRKMLGPSPLSRMVLAEEE